MQFALDKRTRERIGPSKFDHALCPLCEESVIAKCGEIVSHHWAHESTSSCEGAKEETEWHVKWKERFPEMDRERVHINASGEKRVADVRYCGIVYEFQSSVPDPELIRARQSFWTEAGYRFAWIFKKDNLILRREDSNTYRVWKVSARSRVANLPFFLDCPDSGWCLRIDSRKMIGDTTMECTGKLMRRETCDLLDPPPRPTTNQ